VTVSQQVRDYVSVGPVFVNKRHDFLMHVRWTRPLRLMLRQFISQTANIYHRSFW